MRFIIILALIILALFPVLLLGYYIYEKDTLKEPKKLLLKLFLAGLISSGLVIVIDICIEAICPKFYLFSDSYEMNKLITFLLVFLEIGFLEEIVKWYFIRVIGYENKEFDQIYDIIVYSCYLALGFAFFENLFYVLDGGIRVGILRGLIAVPAHAAFGVFMGYFLGKARLSKDKKSYFKYIFLSIFIPSILHTIYDYLLLFESNTMFNLLIIYMIIVYTIAFKIINKLSKIKKSID